MVAFAKVGLSGVQPNPRLRRRAQWVLMYNGIITHALRSESSLILDVVLE